MVNNVNVTSVKTLDDYYAQPDTVCEQVKIQQRKVIKKNSRENLLRRLNSINFVSAPCGSGKTHWLAKYFSDTNYCQNNLVAFPTIELLMQFSKMLDELKIGEFSGLNHRIITGETNPKRVVQTLREHLEDSNEMGGIILTTHEAIFRLKVCKALLNWNVFIDEIPNIDEHHYFHLPDNPKHILDYIDVIVDDGDFNKTSVYSVKINENKRSELYKLVHSHDDSVKEVFIKFYRALLAPHTDIFINARSLEILKSNGSDQIDLVSILKPNQIFNWTIMSANFEDTMFHVLYKRMYKVLFKEFTSITKKLRTMPDKTITLSYYLDKDYSITMRDKPDWNVGQQINELISSYADDTDWLYTSNVDWDFRPVGFQYISPKAHGLNQYTHINNMAINYSENRHPAHIRLLETLGISSDEIKKGTYYQSLLQALSRTGIRNPNENLEHHFIIPDKGAANYLKTIFGEKTTVEKIGNIQISAPTLDKKQIDARYRNKNLISNLLTPDVIDNTCDDIISVTFHEEICGNNSTKKFKSPLNILKTLHKQASIVRLANEPNAFISSGVFSNENSARSHDNFIHSSLMILKFDNGQFSPDDFINLFWNDCDKKLRHTFLICNSWSRSEEEPNSFMVFMPTNRKMKSVDEFQMVYDYILNRILNLESDPRIDPNCRSGVISVPLPCINIEHQNFEPYKPYGTERQLLPVNVIIDNKITHTKPTQCNRVQLGNDVSTNNYAVVITSRCKYVIS